MCVCVCVCVCGVCVCVCVCGVVWCVCVWCGVVCVWCGVVWCVYLQCLPVQGYGILNQALFPLDVGQVVEGVSVGGIHPQSCVVALLGFYHLPAV